MVKEAVLLGLIGSWECRLDSFQSKTRRNNSGNTGEIGFIFLNSGYS